MRHALYALAAVALALLTAAPASAAPGALNVQKVIRVDLMSSEHTRFLGKVLSPPDARPLRNGTRPCATCSKVSGPRRRGAGSGFDSFLPNPARLRG